MEILQYGFMQRAFVVGLLLAVITPCIGITIVLKRLSMVGDALSHWQVQHLDFYLESIRYLVRGRFALLRHLELKLFEKKYRVTRRWQLRSLCRRESGWQVCFPVLWKTVRTLTAFYLEVLCRSAGEKCSQYVSLVWQSCLCLASFPENFSILDLTKMRQESPAFRSDK